MFLEYAQCSHYIDLLEHQYLLQIVLALLKEGKLKTRTQSTLYHTL
jgi:hypothetical protein